MPIKSPEAIAKNKAYHRDLRNWYKAAGICFVCKTRYCEPGRTQCKQCTQRIKARAEKRDPGRIARNAYCAARREALKARGICVDCGKREATEGRTRCGVCARKKSESQQAARIRKKHQREEF